MRIKYILFLFLIYCWSMVNAQQPELIGEWVQETTTWFFYDGDSTICSILSPEVLSLKANERYKIIYYSFDLDDQMNLKPHKNKVLGRYSLNDGQITYYPKHFQPSTREYLLQGNLLTMTQREDGVVKIQTVVTTYKRRSL